MRHADAANGLTPSGLLLVRRFLGDYARNPVNLLILVLVPVAYVAAAAGSLAQFAKLLSGAAAPGAAVQTVTAGWAAAFIPRGPGSSPKRAVHWCRRPCGRYTAAIVWDEGPERLRCVALAARPFVGPGG